MSEMPPLADLFINWLYKIAHNKGFILFMISCPERSRSLEQRKQAYRLHEKRKLNSEDFH